MPLFINKIYDSSGGWKNITSSASLEFEEIKEVFLDVDNYDGSMIELKKRISASLKDKDWQSRYYPGGGVLARFTKVNSDPQKISFFARKESIVFDINTGSPTYIDSWVSFKAKIMSYNGFIPVLALPLVDDSSLASRLTFEYAVERISHLEIVEGNQFIIIGYSSSPEYLQVLESDSVILRTITFEPHQIQAGIGLLSYFSEILKQRMVNDDNKVTIEQDGEKVRLSIKSQAGSTHTVEALLDDYGLVLSGDLPPEKFISDEVQLLSLRNKLDLAAIEIRHQKDILALTKSSYEGRIESMEDQLKHLKTTLSKSISSNKTAQKHVSSLIAKFGNGSSLDTKLVELSEKIDNGLSKADEADFKSTLRAVSEDNPVLAQEFLKLLKGPLEGVAGNIIYSWLPSVSQLVGSIIR